MKENIPVDPIYIPGLFLTASKPSKTWILSFHKVNYIIQYITKEFTIKTFELTHREMEEETKILSASNAHGTKEHNKENENIELRFTIEPDSEHFKRWKRKYLTTKYK